MRFIATQTKQLNKKKTNNKNKISNILELYIRLLKSPELHADRILSRRLL